MTDRSLPQIEAFTGLKMFAGKQEEAQNHLREGKAKGKVISAQMRLIFRNKGGQFVMLELYERCVACRML